MHYNVPQFIDIEDTIVGPLTAKQILWLFGLAGLLFIIWSFVRDKGIFITIAIPISALFFALAFYKPNGQPLIKYIMHAVFFVARPKIYIWRRGEVVNQEKIRKTPTKVRKFEGKQMKREEIEKLARILDSEGEILKK